MRGEAELEAAAASLINAARMGKKPLERELGSGFPDTAFVLAMLSNKNDLDDYIEYGASEAKAGRYYREEARIVAEARKQRREYERAYGIAYRLLLSGESTTAGLGASAPKTGHAGMAEGPSPLAAPGELSLPSRKRLKYNHSYALDVFFRNVDKQGEAELGPEIHALYPGIVVCSASDWKGGAGIEGWKSGGLSPAAGNGVVVFNPESGLYTSYFHLSSTGLRAGDIVAAGDAIGKGGNTGMNARKRNHGGHLHLEVFDARRSAHLTCYELYDLLRGL